LEATEFLVSGNRFSDAPPPSAARRPFRLGCEQLPDRINPTHVTFSSSSFPIQNGQFDYDDAVVDSDLSSQTVPFTNFGFAIDTTDPNTGQIIHNQYTADTTPEAEFEYGAFHSVHIEASTSNPQLPHFGIDLDHGITDTATVYNSFTGTTSTYSVILALPQKRIAVDFASNTTGKDYKIRIQYRINGMNTRLDVSIGMAATTADIATAVGNALTGAGFTVTKNGTQLDIKAPSNINLTEIRFNNYTKKDSNGTPIIDTTIKGPTYVSSYKVDLYVNGVKVHDD
jgi:hypothetical protein